MNVQNKWLALWSLTSVITDGPEGAVDFLRGYRPVGKVFDSTQRIAYLWNVTIPTLPSGAAIRYVLADDLLVGSAGTSGHRFGGIGTALPNVAAAVQGTIKGYEEAAITETFGSNIFTLLITLGLIIVLKPFTIIAKVFYFDLTWMIIIHLLMISFLFKGYTLHEESITRIEGPSLVIFYIISGYVIIYDSQKIFHPAHIDIAGIER